MDTTLSLAEFSIALGTATVIAIGVILTVTKMLIGQVLRSIKESGARQEKAWEESWMRQEKAWKKSGARQEKAWKKSGARYFDDLQEIKSGMKQMNDRIEDLAHAMYDINGQLQRIVGILDWKGSLLKKSPALVDSLKCPGVLPRPCPLHNKDHSDR